MTSLVLPVAGRSSRFPGTPPKWLLTMPDGKLMIESAVDGLKMDFFSRVLVVCLKQHLDEYVNKQLLCESLAKNIRPDIELLILNEPTASHAETVFRALDESNITGPVFIKDCDNRFSFDERSGNFVTCVNLKDVDLVDAKSKSYVEFNEFGLVRNIVEKEVISDTFCCGGYGFESAEMYCQTFLDMVNQQPSNSSEIYISHVIFKMLMNNVAFASVAARDYEDWGTLREYRHMARKSITIFCDIDGVLFLSGSKVGKFGWKTEPIAKNIAQLKSLKEAGNVHLVLTSSRPKSERQYIEQVLEAFGVEADNLVMGLPFNRRIFIDDFNHSNPYPAVVALNVPSDFADINSYLDLLDR